MADPKSAPAFGAQFTEHMLVQRYENGVWSKLEITPFQPFTLSPAAVVFHYGQELFEGFKAYRQPDGSVCMFRPLANMARLNKTAERMCMPTVNGEEVCAGIANLIRADKSFIPERPNTLYIRPCMIATDAVIKVHASSAYTFFVIICVVGDYFAGSDPRGVRLRTETEYVRAAPGGTGAAKCGGNYAGSLLAQRKAGQEGFDQVVWLDAIERRYIEEMGGMNIMFVLNDALVTAPTTTNTILPGVTRDSLLTLAKAMGRKVEERQLSCEELTAAQESGKLQEAFACGTAAAVTPIREIVHRRKIMFQNKTDKPGELTMKLRNALMDLQFGTAPDPYGWRYKV